jgi:hypothetical protein
VELDRIEGNQSEVRDPTTVSTGHTALGATIDEPQQFDWARDVDDSLGLSPIVFNNDRVIVHVNAIPQVCGKATPFELEPGDVADGPTGVALTSTAPTDPIPVDPDLNLPIYFKLTPINPIHGKPEPAALNNPVPTVPIDPDPNNHTMLTAAVPVDPAAAVLSDIAVDQLTPIDIPWELARPPTDPHPGQHISWHHHHCG